MKCRWLLGSLLVVGLLSSGFNAALAGEKKERKEKHAQVSLMKATKIALKVFQVKQAELEEENGRLIWSFDIAAPKTQQVFEVHVDAVSGKIVAVELETPAQQAKEAEHDAKAAKQENRKTIKKSERQEEGEAEESDREGGGGNGIR